MRIKTDPTPQPQVNPAALRRAHGPQPQQGGPSDAKAVTSGTDSVKVTLSSKARELAAAGEPDFDQAKVDRLRAALDKGELKIDPQAIAAKIVED